ncbi:hypothetical protein BX600DRAFT_37684 [Xylariales sp. PMI_506]|nr:hypothetical protein BX600DRAFT_37684 [Xylariales sp. PMI_506]
MDITMPVIGGIEAIRQIRAFETTGGLRRAVVFGLTTATELPGSLLELQTYTDAGFDILVQKSRLLSPQGIMEILFGDPTTNFIIQYGNLTAEEQKPYPLRPLIPLQSRPLLEPTGEPTGEGSPDTTLHGRVNPAGVSSTTVPALPITVPYETTSVSGYLGAESTES